MDEEQAAPQQQDDPSPREERDENMKNQEKSSNWGGHRENSGRKPRLEFTARELFNNFFDENWDVIKGHLEKWIIKGDRFIIEKLIEQRIGKAPQPLKVSGEKEGEPVVVLLQYGDRTALQLQTKDIPTASA